MARERGVFTAKVRGDRPDTDQLNAARDGLPTLLEISGRAGHLEVVDIDHEQQPE
jgi:hypothetical protein